MCGIFAILQKECDSDQDIRNDMVDGLCTVMNRGYDSIGIVFMDPVVIFKTCDTLNSIKSDIRSMTGLKRNAMGHTRWATHGEVNIKNCHPHISESRRFLIVHNGIVKNERIFSAFIRDAGVELTTDTDSEMIVQMIDILSRNRDKTVSDCIQAVVNILEGNFAIIVQDTSTPDRMYCCRRGNPLLIGKRQTDDNFVVCSEKNGLGLCSMIIEPYDDRVIVLDKHYEFTKMDGIFLDTASQTDSERKLKSESTCWTDQEMREQPDLIEEIIRARFYPDYGFFFSEMSAHEADIKKKCRHYEHLFLMGCGTSYNAALASCAWFRKKKIFNTVQAYDAVDFDMSIIPRDGKILWVIVSQSGETLDLLVLLENLPSDSFVIGFFNVRDSLLWRRCQHPIYVMAGREQGVASTKSFTCQIMHLYIFSQWLDGSSIDMSLFDLSSVIRNTINRFHLLEEWKNRLMTTSSLLLLGRNNGLITAIESSLKLKELSRIHCESYSSGSLKHGPFALLDENMPVLYIYTDDTDQNRTILSLREILSRKSHVYLLTPSSVPGFPFFNHPRLHIIVYPSHPIMCFLPPIILLQELSIRISLMKGFCVDFPRNLAKTVTVE